MRKKRRAFESSPLPTPKHYVEHDQVPFFRMAAACGLTCDLPELLDYRLPSETTDQTPPRPEPFEPDNDDGGGPRPTPGWLGR